MYITETHKYKLNGKVYVGGEMPNGAELLETMTILNADDGKVLKKGEEQTSSVWLKDDDSQDNYVEVYFVEEDYAN